MTRLQIEILKQLRRNVKLGVLGLEDRCQFRTPRELRQDLGELVVNGLVEQTRDPKEGYIDGYVLTQLGMQRANDFPPGA